MRCCIRWIAPTPFLKLYAWLERCGLAFGRWIEQAPYLPQCGMVAKSPHAARLASLPSPLQHAAIELLRGTMVMHNFIAYRDDRSGDAQPITFAGERWRDYVPIALPWTVCVRERVPPGSVAVLINRAHTFTDLICTVDAFEDRLLGAIDGKRTLAEILRQWAKTSATSAERSSSSNGSGNTTRSSSTHRAPRDRHVATVQRPCIVASVGVSF